MKSEDLVEVKHETMQPIKTAKMAKAVHAMEQVASLHNTFDFFELSGGSPFVQEKPKEGKKVVLPIKGKRQRNEFVKEVTDEVDEE